MVLPRCSILRSSDASAGLLARVRDLLDEAFGGDFSDDDWSHALGGWHALVMLGDRIVSHAAVVPRTIEVGDTPLRCGYLEAVATRPDQRGHGHATRLLTELSPVIRREFDIGMLSTSVHAFYAGLGWERWQGPTFTTANGERIRTTEDDDGIMALRFGAHAAIPLNSPITCNARTGDDW